MLKRGAFESFDRISSLPKEVIGEILILLPIRDAIKTSLLSSNWRYKWNSMPQLVFNRDSMLSTKNSDLVKFVDCVLLLHNGVISEFKLVKFLDICCSDVERWMVVLSKKGLQHLVLSFKKEGEFYKAPTCLFNCEKLRTLSLDRCELRVPSQFRGMSYLTNLEFRYVRLTNETFEKLVLELPFLGTLKLVRCKPLDRINVRAQNLKAVHIYDFITSINFHNSPNIVNLYMRPGMSRTQSLDDILYGLDELQFVDLTYPRIKLNFAPDAAWVELHAIYHRLTCAVFRINFRDPSQILSVIFLCRRSPCLEKLKIVDTANFSFGITFKEPFWDARLRKEDVFHHLKSVRLDGFRGTELELGLAQFILMNALVLETLDISWKHVMLKDCEKLRAVVKITQFERASSKAKVIFCD
ncbi:hypothetical protein ACHQM5_001201 [Ranunculus cassubicifolius]